MAVKLLRNRVERCSLAVVACGVQLTAQSNVFCDLEFGAFQLNNVRAELSDNRARGCARGAAVSLSSDGGRIGCSSARLHKNRFHQNAVALRLSSIGGASCALEASDDSYSENGDGVFVLSAGCTASFSGGEIIRSSRCGLRVGRGARACIKACQIVGNGRGIAVASQGSADIQECVFKDNVGWALRFEDSYSAATGPEAHAASSALESVVSKNVFHGVSRGNVGRKRIRIDANHESSVSTDRNQGSPGPLEIEPFRKRRCVGTGAVDSETGAEAATTMLAALSLDHRQ